MLLNVKLFFFMIAFNLCDASVRLKHFLGARQGSSTLLASTLIKSEETTFIYRVLKGYSNLLERAPYPTKMISSGIVAATGDILIQLIQCSRSKNSFDFRRLLIFSTNAALYIAPACNVWFNWLDRLTFPPVLNKNKYSRAAAQMLLDQTIGALIINVGFFYAYEVVTFLIPPYKKSLFAGFLALDFVHSGTRSMVSKIWETLVMNWYCWPVINFVNFLYIPVQFRVLFSNFAAIFWNMFLSTVAYRAA